MRLSWGEITVLKDSGALVESFTTNHYKGLRQQLIEDGRLVSGSDPQLLHFAEDVTFASPSAAASVIFNRNTNGRTAWIVKDANQTLKELQDAQIPDPDV
jgi:uncharacterized protein DUF4357